MFLFAQKANRLVWNAQFDEAESLLKPHASTNPRCALEMSGIISLKAFISGSSTERGASIEVLNIAQKSLASVNSKAKILALAKSTIELNKEVKDQPALFNEKTKSLIPHKSHGVRLSSTSTPPEQMSDQELLQNFEFDLKVIDAELALWVGISQLNDGAFLKGAYNLRRSWKAYESLLKTLEKEDAKAQDNDPCVLVHHDIVQSVLFGVGMFYYLLSVLPPTVTKVLEFIGFKKNRSLGIEYLDYVASNRGLKSGSAIFMLSFNYLFVPTALSDKHEQLARFKPHLDFVLEAYPQGALFLLSASQFERKLGDYETAIVHLNTAIDVCQKMGATPHSMDYELGQCYFVQQNFEEARKIFEKLVAVNDTFDVKAFSAISLAVCHHNLGDWEKAQELIPTICSMTTKKSRFDVYVIEKIKLLERSSNDTEKKLILKLTQFELLYLKRDIHHMKPDTLNVLLKDLESIHEELEHVKMGDVKAATFVINASLLRSLGEEEKAAQLFDKAIAIEKEVKYEKQWLASAAYERGEQEYYAKNLKRCYEYMKRSSSYSKYPFEEVIKSRAKIALTTVKAEMK